MLRGLLHVKRPRPRVPPFDLARAAEVRRWRDRLPLSLSLDTIGDENLADATAVGLCVEAHLAGVGFGRRPLICRAGNTSARPKFISCKDQSGPPKMVPPAMGLV